jgi:hypothetical protein
MLTTRVSPACTGSVTGLLVTSWPGGIVTELLPLKVTGTTVPGTAAAPLVPALSPMVTAPKVSGIGPHWLENRRLTQRPPTATVARSLTVALSAASFGKGWSNRSIGDVQAVRVAGGAGLDGEVATEEEGADEATGAFC